MNWIVYYSTSAYSAASQSVTYSTSFSNLYYSVVTTITESSSQSTDMQVKHVSIWNKATTGCTFRLTDYGKSLIAIGY